MGIARTLWGLVWASWSSYHGRVTSKERLWALVEGLPEAQAEELLRVARDLFEVPGERQPLPAFVGIGDSGRSDVSERVDDLLGEGFVLR
jgi:hypothetical protein